MTAGRPTKLTPEVQKKLCDAIRAGNYYEPSAIYAGIDYQTFRNWMIKGESAKRGKFFDFFEAVRKAEAEAEISVVAQWKQQIPDNWAAARDFLARRQPERWGPKEKITQEITGKDGAQLGIVVKVMRGVNLDDL